MAELHLARAAHPVRASIPNHVTTTCAGAALRGKETQAHMHTKVRISHPDAITPLRLCDAPPSREASAVTPFCGRTACAWSLDALRSCGRRRRPYTAPTCQQGSPARPSPPLPLRPTISILRDPRSGIVVLACGSTCFRGALSPSNDNSRLAYKRGRRTSLQLPGLVSPSPFGPGESKPDSRSQPCKRPVPRCRSAWSQ